jgi:hypothetical protein
MLNWFWALSEDNRVTLMVALVGNAVTLSIALFSLRQAYGLTAASRRAESDRDRTRLAHERELATDERTFQRRADAYVEVLTVLNHQWAVIELTLPVIGRGIEPPEWPSDAERWRSDALVAAFGSAEMRGRMESLRRAASDFFGEVGKYRDMKEDEAQSGGPSLRESWGLSAVEQYRIVERTRDQYRDSMQAVRDQIAHELGPGVEASPAPVSGPPEVVG